MGSYEVTRIVRDAENHIETLGGPKFKISPTEHVIRWIEDGHRFWVSACGERSTIELDIQEGQKRLVVRVPAAACADDFAMSASGCPAVPV